MALDLIQYAPIIRTPVQFTYNGDTSWKVKILHPNQANRDGQTNLRFIVYDSDRIKSYIYADQDCDFTVADGIQEVTLSALNNISWAQGSASDKLSFTATKNYKIQVCYGKETPSEGYWSQAKIFTYCTEPTINFNPVYSKVSNMPDKESVTEVKIVEVNKTTGIETDLTDWYRPISEENQGVLFFKNVDISKYLDAGTNPALKWYFKTTSGKEFSVTSKSWSSGSDFSYYVGNETVSFNAQSFSGEKFLYYPIANGTGKEILTIPLRNTKTTYYWLPPAPDGNVYAWNYYQSAGISTIQKVTASFVTNEEGAKEYGQYPVLCDKDNTLMMKFNSLPASFKRTIQEQKQDTIGGEYPYISRNGQANYAEIPFKILLSSDCGPLSNAEREAEKKMTAEGRSGTENGSTPVTSKYAMEPYVIEKQYRDEVLQWLTNGEVKIFRSITEGVFAVRLMNVSCTPQTSLGNKYYEISGTMYEVEPVNQWVIENYVVGHYTI